MRVPAIRLHPRRGAEGAPQSAPGIVLSAAVCMIFASALPLSAREFTPPSGCQSFATIQSRACSVSVVWRCDLAPDGDFWEANFSSDGLESVVSYDGDYQWLDAAYNWDQSREELAPPAADRISVAELLETGVDTFDFTMRRVTPDRRYDIRVTGADMLTGETAMIDGYELDEVKTRLEIIDDEGVVEYASEGIQYYSRDLGLFFLGAEKVFEPNGQTSAYDDGPADIILPGEPGFEATRPLYGCNLQDARLAIPGGSSHAG